MLNTDSNNLSDNKKKIKDIHLEALDRFKQSEDASNDNRNDALEDLKFGRLGKQWPDGIRRERERQGRPCLVINRLPAFIRQVVNDARQNKPQIKVHPVDSQADIETAKIYDGLIRNIEVISRADIAYDTAIDYAVSAGFGYVRVITDYGHDDTFDQDILIERVGDPFCVYEDAFSKSADGSDWNYAFVTEVLTQKEFEAAYPKAEKIDFETDGRDEKTLSWFGEDSVRVAEYWKRDKVKDVIYQLSTGENIRKAQYEENLELFQGAGIEIVDEREIESFKVKCYKMNGKEILNGEGEDWPGIYIPIIPVYGEELNIEGKRIIQSLIRQAKDSQQNFNYWRSAATELVALAPKAPFIGPKGFAKSDANWDTANVENHAYLEYDGNVAPQRQPFAGLPAGALQEALNASDDLKDIMGMHDASLGARSNETSGRAIMARQKEGDVSTFNFIDNLSRAIRQVGAIIIDLIPHIYSEERIIRVLGEDGTPKSVPVNQPIMVDDKGEVVPNGQQSPTAMQRIYDLTTGKYDLTVSSGPSFNTKREEAAFQMTEFVRSFPEAAPIVGDLLAKNLDWPGADEIAERLKSINPVLQKEQQKNQPPQPSPEEMKMQAEIQLKQQELKMRQEEGRLKIAEKQAELQIKQIDLQIKQTELQIQQDRSRSEIIKSHNDKYESNSERASGNG